MIKVPMSYDTIKTAKRWLHFLKLFVSKVHCVLTHTMRRTYTNTIPNILTGIGPNRFFPQRRLFSNIQNLLKRLFKISSVYQVFSLLLQSQSVKFLASAVKTIFDNNTCKVLIWKMKVMSLIWRQIQNQRPEKNSNT